MAVTSESAADCLELAAAFEDLFDPDRPTGARLIAWVEGTAEAIRATSVRRDERRAVREIAAELQTLVAELGALVDGGSVAGAGEIDAQAIGEIMERLEAADRFAATTSLGPFLDCGDDGAAGERLVVQATLAADGVTVVVPATSGPARLEFTNASTEEAGAVLIWSEAPMSVPELVAMLDGDDDADGDLSFAVVVVVEAIAPGQGSSTDLLLPQGHFAVLPVDAAGVVSSDPTTIAAFSLNGETESLPSEAEPTT